MKTLSPYLKALFELVYPSLCEYCQQETKVREEPFCVPCLCQLPYTGHELKKENPFSNHFYGETLPENSAALFHLQQGGQVEKMLYRLKYHSRPKTGVELGIFFGKMLSELENWAVIQAIIPVPLHYQKELARGYNQSERFARGLGKAMGIPVLNHVLKRKIHTSTQTRMNRMERLKNTQNAFEVVDGSVLTDQHILLVDDVLTTGSTLKACAAELITIKGIHISMATIAMGSM